MRSTLVSRVLPLALLPMMTGCVLTRPMWEDANDRIAAGPVVFGVIDARGGEAGPDDGRRLLVIRYPLHFDSSLYASIPLDPHGRPAEPYGYAGTERRVDAIVNDLPEARRRQLRDMRLVLYDDRWAKRLRADPHFRETEPWTDGTIHGDVSFDGNDRDDTGRDELRVIAFRLGRTWTDAERAAMRLDDKREGTDQRTLPAEARVLVLPHDQPRPDAHYRKAQRRAALLTPMTLVGDELVIFPGIPVVLVVYILFGKVPIPG